MCVCVCRFALHQTLSEIYSSADIVCQLPTITILYELVYIILYRAKEVRRDDEVCRRCSIYIRNYTTSSYRYKRLNDQTNYLTPAKVS